jgi:hypothetical protein
VEATYVVEVEFTEEDARLIVVNQLVCSRARYTTAFEKARTGYTLRRSSQNKRKQWQDANPTLKSHGRYYRQTCSRRFGQRRGKERPALPHRRAYTCASPTCCCDSWLTFLLQGASITFRSAYIGDAKMLASRDSIPKHSIVSTLAPQPRVHEAMWK